MRVKISFQGKCNISDYKRLMKKRERERERKKERRGAAKHRQDERLSVT